MGESLTVRDVLPLIRPLGTSLVCGIALWIVCQRSVVDEDGEAVKGTPYNNNMYDALGDMAQCH